MSDAIDKNPSLFIVDFKQDSLIAAADAVGVLQRKLLYPERARIICQKGNAGSDSLNLFLWKRIEVSLS